MDEKTEYTIRIANKKLQFFTTDKEEHVRNVERKLADAFEEVTGSDSTGINSQNSLKLAIRLADEIVRKEKGINTELIYDRIIPIIDSLDKILEPD